MNYFLPTILFSIYYILGVFLNFFVFKKEGFLLFCPFGVFPFLHFLRVCFINNDDEFEGWYFKNQKGDVTLSLIPGRSKNEAFIQVITQDRSYNIIYPLSDFLKKGNDGEIVQINQSNFSLDGIHVDIHSKEDSLDLSGSLHYNFSIPIKYDIMGPFKYFPMECRHEILSMHHDLQGILTLNGQVYDFSGGNGYLEGDRGTSFPEHYTWVQCNDFEADHAVSPCAVMASIALIPFMGLRFWGCICIVRCGGEEHRLATYLGASVVCRTRNALELRQRGLRLRVDVPNHSGHKLQAPANGAMVRTIHESAAVRARFQFWKGKQNLLDGESEHASFEFVE